MAPDGAIFSEPKDHRRGSGPRSFKIKISQGIYELSTTRALSDAKQNFRRHMRWIRARRRHLLPEDRRGHGKPNDRSIPAYTARSRRLAVLHARLSAPVDR